MNIFKKLSTAILLGSVVVMSSALFAETNEKGRGTGPVVFVTSQGLYFDTIVLGDLPMQGDFQQLIPGTNGLMTEFGPGDVGHLGGRWWIDMNGDGIMDKSDKYFMCPLLGPGRDTL